MQTPQVEDTTQNFFILSYNPLYKSVKSVFDALNRSAQDRQNILMEHVAIHLSPKRRDRDMLYLWRRSSKAQAPQVVTKSFRRGLMRTIADVISRAFSVCIKPLLKLFITCGACALVLVYHTCSMHLSCRFGERDALELFSKINHY